MKNHIIGDIPMISPVRPLILDYFMAIQPTMSIGAI